jgi:hypothetical protein
VPRNCCTGYSGSTRPWRRSSSGLLPARRAIPSSWRRACAPWWRPGYWSASAGPIAWDKPCRLPRYQPLCRRCWRRASTAHRLTRSACCTRLRLSAPRFPSRYCRRSPSCPR